MFPIFLLIFLCSCHCYNPLSTSSLQKFPSQLLSRLILLLLLYIAMKKEQKIATPRAPSSGCPWQRLCLVHLSVGLQAPPSFSRVLHHKPATAAGLCSQRSTQTRGVGSVFKTIPHKHHVGGTIEILFCPATEPVH